MSKIMLADPKAIILLRKKTELLSSLSECLEKGKHGSSVCYVGNVLNLTDDPRTYEAISVLEDKARANLEDLRRQEKEIKTKLEQDIASVYTTAMHDLYHATLEEIRNFDFEPVSADTKIPILEEYPSRKT